MAGSVNLRFARGAIGNIESYVQCLYGYDIRTEIVGSKGSILIGGLRQNSATFFKPNHGSYELEDHFLSRFREAYVAEVDRLRRHHSERPRPSRHRRRWLACVEIAVAAEKSLRTAAPCLVAAGRVRVRSLNERPSSPSTSPQPAVVKFSRLHLKVLRLSPFAAIVYPSVRLVIMNVALQPPSLHPDTVLKEATEAV